eukprot:360512-Chlamydomonas_euryale.AAC.5
MEGWGCYQEGWPAADVEVWKRPQFAQSRPGKASRQSEIRYGAVRNERSAVEFRALLGAALKLRTHDEARRHHDATGHAAGATVWTAVGPQPKAVRAGTGAVDPGTQRAATAAVAPASPRLGIPRSNCHSLLPPARPPPTQRVRPPRTQAPPRCPSAPHSSFHPPLGYPPSPSPPTAHPQIPPARVKACPYATPRADRGCAVSRLHGPRGWRSPPVAAAAVSALLRVRAGNQRPSADSGFREVAVAATALDPALPPGTGGAGRGGSAETLRTSGCQRSGTSPGMPYARQMGEAAGRVLYLILPDGWVKLLDGSCT